MNSFSWQQATASSSSPRPSAEVAEYEPRRRYSKQFVREGVSPRSPPCASFSPRMAAPSSPPAPRRGSFVVLDVAADRERSLLSFRRVSLVAQVARRHYCSASFLKRVVLASVMILATLVLVKSGGSPKEGMNLVLEKGRSVTNVMAMPNVERLLAWRSSHPVQEPYIALDPELVLNSAEPSGGSLQAQLKTGHRYVTTLGYGGHTNQILAFMNLLYIAKITSRIAIIPTLIPIHIEGGSPLNISEVYDLPRLYHESRIPLVEWWRVKKYGNSPAEADSMSCWSSQEIVVGHGHTRPFSSQIHMTGVTLWPMPPTMQRAANGFELAFDAVKIFDYNKVAQYQWLEQVQREQLPRNIAPDGSILPTLKQGFNISSPPPSDQLLCFDNTLFMSHLPFSAPFVVDPPLDPVVVGEGPSWEEAGQHLRFTRQVENHVDAYLMKIFEVSAPSKLPPFITIHIRRGDFIDWGDYATLEKFSTALSRLVIALQARLDRPRTSSSPSRLPYRSLGPLRAAELPVLITTDEVTGSPFLAEVKALGWKVLDHGELGTVARLGPWWPTILDAGVLARGVGFVGTPRSTFSHIAGLRVKFWNGGLVESATDVAV